MTKLWQKNYTLDTLIEAFTVGRDYLLDRNLIASDCLGSLAHATMLQSIGIISSTELTSIKEGLLTIIDLNEKNEFSITPSDEDCHTAIENYLINSIGEAGKKIHTGRSRNDQVLTALRIYGREFILHAMNSGLTFIDTLLTCAHTYKNIPMAGRTHMQLAMPSSVGLWAAAYGEALYDDLTFLWNCYDINNQCPLGSAASYGVPIPLNREMSAQLLGFSTVQNNVLYVNNSRGKIESFIMDAIDHIGITLSKAAQDLILFTMPEFNYFSLPPELCSGSSIMPQKKNPDALELMRAKSGTLSSYCQNIKNVIRSLPSGYNRDYQDTKEPFILGSRLAIQCIEIMNLTFKKLEVHEDSLTKAFLPEIYATDAAIESVLEGKSFRDAYREVGTNLDKLASRDPQTTLNSRTSSGTTGNLQLNILQERTETLRSIVDSEAQRLHTIQNRLVDNKTVTIF